MQSLWVPHAKYPLHLSNDINKDKENLGNIKNWCWSASASVDQTSILVYTKTDPGTRGNHKMQSQWQTTDCNLNQVPIIINIFIHAQSAHVKNWSLLFKLDHIFLQSIARWNSLQNYNYLTRILQITSHESRILIR